MDLPIHLLAVAALVAFTFSLYLWKSTPSRHRVNAPPELPGALPIIGHLHRISPAKPIFRTMADMAAKHGPVFSLRLGTPRYLVVSSRDAVRDCLSRNDSVFAFRPRSSHGEHLGYGFAAFGFAPYGRYWRTVKKLVVSGLLSRRHVCLPETEALVKGLYGGGGARVVALSEWIEHFTLNVITEMIAGKRYFDGTGGGEAERIGKLIKEYMLISGINIVSDMIPIPKWIDVNGNLKAMKRIGREIDELIESWIEEHKNRDVATEKQDFIDVLLSVIEEGSELGYDRDTIIKGTVSNLIIAGSDTTALTLTWNLALLLNNKHALKRAQDELDLAVGRDRWVEDSDIKNLPYLQAVVKETLRLYPTAPLSVPHEASEDCTVCGFHVPKGTRLFINLWRLHRDPDVWLEPELFEPDRFLTTHAGIDASGTHYEFIPFGSGRRSCPGMGFGLHMTHLVLARILQGFDLAAPLGGAVDMSEGFGITLARTTPLEALVSPRLTDEMYQ